jgi:hypothetical protein
MKRIFVLLFTVSCYTASQAQTVTPAKDDHAGHNHGPITIAQPSTAEVLELKEIEFDFGTIPQGKPVYHYFEIKNKGTQALKLDNIQTTCGCTTPEWSKEPIKAGASTKIKVGYNAATEGYFEKFITVQYNGSGTKQIKIKGTVWKAPVGAAPPNAAVQFLKTQIQ